MDKSITEYAGLYKSGKLENPTRYYDDDYGYYLKKVKYFFGMYSHNDTAIGWGGSVNHRMNRQYTFKTLRNHARGLQDVTKYKDIIDPVRESGKHKGKRLLNISWQILPIIPKFRNLVKTKYRDIILNPQVVAIDHESQLTKQDMKNKMKLVRQPESKAFMQGEGYAPDEPDQMKSLTTPEDVEVMAKMGGIRLATEIMFKNALDFSFKESGWESMVDMLAEDIIDLNACAIEQYCHNGVQQVRYIDPVRLILDSSMYPDYRDNTYRGYFEQMKYQTLKMIEPDLSPRAEQVIRKRFQGQAYAATSNLYRGNGNREEYASHTRQSTYATEDFAIQTANLYWLDTGLERFVTGQHPRGSRIFEKVGPDFTLSERGKRAGKKIEEFEVARLHKCRWVVGTDIIFDYGIVDEVTNMGVNGSRTVKWPITVYVGQEPSLVEKAISFDDDIQLANFKIRAMVSKMAPGPRMIIFKNRIRDSINLNDDTITIPDIIKMYQSDGVMILDEEQEYSLPGENPYAQSDPIRFLPSGIAEDMAIMENRILSGIDKIRQGWGVSEVADGTTSNPDMLKGVMEGLMYASNNALKPYINPYIYLYRQVCEYMIHKYQLMVIDGDVRLGLLPLGDYTSELIQLDKSLLNHEWGLYIDLNTQETKEMLVQQLFARQDLPSDAVFIVWNAIIANDLRQAQFLLAKYIQKANQEAHQRQMEIAQATNAGAAQAAVQAEQAKRGNLELQHTFNKDLELLRHNLKMKEDQLSAGQDLQKISKQEEKRKETAVATVKANQKPSQAY
jgi:hypothetical protein